MGRNQARSFRPLVNLLEPKIVLSAPGSLPIVPLVTNPTVFTRAESNQVYTKIDSAFQAYEGPYEDTINAIGNFVSSVLMPSSSSDSNSSDNSLLNSSKGDTGALESRLGAALNRLPGGHQVSASMVDQTFALGGLTPDDAEFFKAKLDSIVRRYLDHGIKTGQIVTVHHVSHHSGTSPG